MGPELIEALARYLHQTGLRKKSGEQGLFVLLGTFLYGKQPLVELLEGGAPFPVCFQYGSHDWMARGEADRLIEEKTIRGCVHTVSESGHHLYI